VFRFHRHVDVAENGLFHTDILMDFTIWKTIKYIKFWCIIFKWLISKSSKVWNLKQSYINHQILESDSPFCVFFVPRIPKSRHRYEKLRYLPIMKTPAEPLAKTWEIRKSMGKFVKIIEWWLVGGWPTYPSEKWWKNNPVMMKVSDDEIPNMMEK